MDSHEHVTRVYFPIKSHRPGGIIFMINILGGYVYVLGSRWCRPARLVASCDGAVMLLRCLASL